MNIPYKIKKMRTINGRYYIYMVPQSPTHTIRYLMDNGNWSTARFYYNNYEQAEKIAKKYCVNTGVVNISIGDKVKILSVEKITIIDNNRIEKTYIRPRWRGRIMIPRDDIYLVESFIEDTDYIIVSSIINTNFYVIVPIVDCKTVKETITVKLHNGISVKILNDDPSLDKIQNINNQGCFWFYNTIHKEIEYKLGYVDNVYFTNIGYIGKASSFGVAYCYPIERIFASFEEALIQIPLLIKG